MCGTRLRIRGLTVWRARGCGRGGGAVLQYANLNFNALTSLNGIEQCKELRQLFIANNRVREMEPLASCQHLEVRLSLIHI